MFKQFRSGLLGVAVAGFAQGALIHQYDLNGSLTDNFGGPSLVSNGGSLGPGSYSFNFGQGLSLSSPGINAEYTIDMMLTLDPACSNKYCKLIDFTNFASDNGFYTAPNNFLNLYPVAIGSNAVGTGAVRITLQRNGAGILIALLNGTQEFSYDDSVTQNYTFAALNNIIQFLQDEGQQGNPGEHPKGSVDWIRIYSQAESPGQYVEGQGPAVPEPATVALTLAGLAWMAGRRGKNRTR